MPRELPKNQLDPKIKNVWRISGAVGITLVYLCCVVAWSIVAIVNPSSAWWAWIVTAAVHPRMACCAFRMDRCRGAPRPDGV